MLPKSEIRIAQYTEILAFLLFFDGSPDYLAKLECMSHSVLDQINVNRTNKNLAVANRSRVSSAHNTSRPFIVTP